MEKLKKNKKKLIWQQRFLYPLLFQIGFYALAYNHSLNKFNLKKIENSNLNKHFSFLTLKRIVKRLRRKRNIDVLNKNYNKIFDINYNNYFYSKVIREGLSLILENFFLVQSKKNFVIKFLRWTNYQYIHKV